MVIKQGVGFKEVGLSGHDISLAIGFGFTGCPLREAQKTHWMVKEGTCSLYLHVDEEVCSSADN